MIEIIGHRGAAFDAPENSLASFQLAWEQKADAIECDVHLSKDGQIVAIHDSDTNRTAGVDRLVADQTLDELRQLDVGSWKDAQFAGERIPKLSEILTTIPPGKRVFIEVKCGPAIIPELMRVLTDAELQSKQTAIISFLPDVVAAVKADLPAIAAYWCVDLHRLNERPIGLSELIADARAIKADGLDLSAHSAITRDFVQASNASTLPVYVWTVNDPILARQLIAAGVAGIATDRPGWLRDQLRM